MYMYLTHLFHFSLLINRNLCDTDKTGKLNKEEFALAMYLIAEKVKGRRELPSSLSPSMIPPSKRKSAKTTITASKSGEGFSGGGATLIPPAGELLKLGTLLPTIHGAFIISVGSFDSTSSISSTGLMSSSSSASILQPTSSIFGSSTPSTTPLIPQTSSSSTSSLPNVGSSGSLLQPMPAASTTPLIPVGGSGGGAMLQPTSTGSTQVGGVGFVADFSLIKELDTLSTEIDSVRK